MKTKDLTEYYFDTTSYSTFTANNHPSELIDDMIRLVMHFHHETNYNENIKNASFIMAWNTLIKLGIYKKLENITE